jgi:hypothetical protein
MKNLFKLQNIKFKKLTKKPAKKTASKVVKKRQPKLAKLPSAWALTKKTWFEVSTFWRPLLGITIVYGILYFILVLGLNLSTTWQYELTYPDSTWGGALGLIFGAFSTGGFDSATASDLTIVMQFLLFILASMAVIWTLRKLQGLKQIKWRDAYYQGSSALVPTVLVTLVLVLTLIPAIIGSSLLATVLQVSATSLEILTVSLITGVLLLLSLLLFVMFWPAFYIISLPQTRPIQALRSALKVTKKRRLSILRKIVAWGFLCLIIMLAILIPLAIFIPSGVSYLVFMLLFILFGFSHVYLYNLYRSLL